MKNIEKLTYKILPEKNVCNFLFPSLTIYVAIAE